MIKIYEIHAAGSEEMYQRQGRRVMPDPLRHFTFTRRYCMSASRQSLLRAANRGRLIQTPIRNCLFDLKYSPRDSLWLGRHFAPWTPK